VGTVEAVKQAAPFVLTLPITGVAEFFPESTTPRNLCVLIVGSAQWPFSLLVIVPVKKRQDPPHRSCPSRTDSRFPDTSCSTLFYK
jgi:hypothetical protein